MLGIRTARRANLSVLQRQSRLCLSSETAPILSNHSGSVRDNAFYEYWSKKRVYFYQIDLRGRLFLDTPNLLRRNDATCLKAKEFLDFFFSHLRNSPSREQAAVIKNSSWREALQQFAQEYPYISPCGRELNLVKAEDLPIVFREIISDSNGEDALLYGGSLCEKFHPEHLFFGKKTERIYYTRENGEISLVHADLAQRLSKGFFVAGEPLWEYKGNRYPFLAK